MGQIFAKMQVYKKSGVLVQVVIQTHQKQLLFQEIFIVSRRLDVQNEFRIDSLLVLLGPDLWDLFCFSKSHKVNKVRLFAWNYDSSRGILGSELNIVWYV
eukprot:TRINITY_DN20056_c0_g1_i2.p3 TRINITY_DN20056_c0_g1~~TRINITY_DN20056_c0_g1_i2.p3  ORF type:complete len:100 (+),score=5.12 TRINITY_DN20056_c0_g1_i2:320-619(+)